MQGLAPLLDADAQFGGDWRVVGRLSGFNHVFQNNLKGSVQPAGILDISSFCDGCNSVGGQGFDHRPVFSSIIIRPHSQKVGNRKSFSPEKV
jgi:hypothetical protein